MELPDLSHMTRASHHRITDRISPWIEHAIAKYAASEKDRILWESQLMPTKDGGAQVCIFVWLPGAEIGTMAQGSFVLPNPFEVNEAMLEEILSQFLSRLRGARSQQVQQQPQQRRSMLDIVRGSGPTT